MLYLSILTSDRNLDPELWALVWNNVKPDDLKLLSAYNLGGDKRVFIWESDSEAGLEFMDVFNYIGKLETYSALDRTDGWQAAFDSNLKTFEEKLKTGLQGCNVSPEKVDDLVSQHSELRKKASLAKNRFAAKVVAEEWKKKMGEIGKANPYLPEKMDANPLEPLDITYEPDSKYQTENRQFQGIPGIEVAPSGLIWATWYSGGVGETYENYSLIVNSTDNGKSWSEPLAVINHPGNVRTFDPTLWIDPLGRLWWFWAQSYSFDDCIFDGKAGVWGAYLKNPNDEKPVFSKPVRLANGIMMNKPTLLSSGEWAMPTAVWNPCEPKLKEMDSQRFSNMTSSTDNGTTFSLKGGANVPRRAYDEHMIVELKDNRLWMLVRTRYGIGESFSSDMGKTWSPGKPSQFKGPSSRFFIRRLSSGNLLFVYHDNELAAENRSHLTAFLSLDDGKSWERKLLLDERENVSYPDGVEDKNGVIRIIYDRERYRQGEIFMASFREEDILAGKCVSADAKMKTLVNKTGGLL